MKISTKGHYSINFLLDLARHTGEGFISLLDVSERQGISKKYLEQIIPILNKGDFLKTSRGAYGGYMLSKLPREITVADVLYLTENIFSAESQVDMSKDMLSLFVIPELNNVLQDYLKSVTLQDLLDKENETYSNNYII